MHCACVYLACSCEGHGVRVVVFFWGGGGGYLSFYGMRYTVIVRRLRYYVVPEFIEFSCKL